MSHIAASCLIIQALLVSGVINHRVLLYPANPYHIVPDEAVYLCISVCYKMDNYTVLESSFK